MRTIKMGDTYTKEQWTLQILTLAKEKLQKYHAVHGAIHESIDYHSLIEKIDSALNEQFFSAEQLEQAKDCENLGPAYFAADDVAKRYMDHFKEDHMKPLVDQITSDIREKVWDDFTDWLFSDTEMNLQSKIRAMVDGTVKALLSGEQWALNLYVLANKYDCEEVRKAIAVHIPEELQNKTISDQAEEIKKLKEDLQWAQRGMG